VSYEYRIEKNPTLGWCAQNLGFIIDMHQINVALTRAKKGLFIIGRIYLNFCSRWYIIYAILYSIVLEKKLYFIDSRNEHGQQKDN
jgi:hypothetical protein